MHFITKTTPVIKKYEIKYKFSGRPSSIFTLNSQILTHRRGTPHFSTLTFNQTYYLGLISTGLHFLILFSILCIYIVLLQSCKTAKYSPAVFLNKIKYIYILFLLKNGVYPSTEPGLPVHAQILPTVKHCARSPVTTLHARVAQTQYVKTIYILK